MSPEMAYTTAIRLADETQWRVRIKVFCNVEQAQMVEMCCRCHLAGGALSNILTIHIPLRQDHFMFLIVKTHEEGEDIRQLQALLEARFPGCIPTVSTPLSSQPRLGIFLQLVDSLILNLFSHSITLSLRSYYHHIHHHNASTPLASFTHL